MNYKPLLHFATCSIIHVEKGTLFESMDFSVDIIRLILDIPRGLLCANTRTRSKEITSKTSTSTEISLI